MNTLYLRIPSRHGATWPFAALDYAVATQEGSVIRQGKSTLAELAGSLSRSNVVLLLAAADVTLLELSIPPMSEAKLKSALPNLVEDQLMSDTKECVLLLGTKTATGKRSVAVAQRSWLQQLSSHFFALGASQVRALPEQLCLPWKKGQCSVRLEDPAVDASLTLRFAEENGAGLLQEPGQSLAELVASAVMLAPPGAMVLQVPSGRASEYKALLQTSAEWQERCTVQESSWADTVQAAKAVGFNLLAGLNSAQTQRVQWQLWRWPLVLALLVLLLNVAALNFDYWTLKRAAQGLRQSMLQTYRSSFPKETVVLFPLEQMSKNLDAARRNSGQASPDDFTLLLTGFGAAWTAVNAAQLPKLVSVEYKDRALLLEVKGELPQKELQAALDVRGLILKKNNAEIWQVRNAK